MASSSESENLPGNRFENFLNERISKTAQQVKWVDLFSITLLLTIGVLGFLFALCLVDAWIIELQLWMRWTAFALVFCGVAAFFVFFLLPLFVKRINPLYAAKKIEDSRPELKNSVINYLSTSLIKGNRPNRVVQQKLTQTAAADVANIPLDLAVDRSRMIFAGYALAGLVALFALYKVLSPKDPFQTIGRVMLPTAELTAPSRVTISEVSPGNDQKYFGEVLEVEARIKGLGKNEFAQLFVTTDDGRRKGYSIPMQFDDQLNVFRAMLSEDGRGLQESLRYWLVAGDATSPEFRVEVKTCPTIFLESAEYFSPAYTEIPDQKIENPDVISGVEGTIVRIQARTNLPIQSAWLELFRETKDPQRSGDEKSGFPAVSELKKVRQVRLDVEDEKLAMGELMLNWNRFRSQAEVTHYQLVFTSLDGDSSENPTLSKIEVTPDLSPEIEVVQPNEKTVEVPLDQTSKIEITAVDPDYRLTRIQLMGDCKGSRLFDKDLLRTQSDDGRVGKQVVQFDFSPVQFGLKPGDEVVLFASAEDNRCMGRNRIFDPLRGRTENYRVLVTEPLSPQDPKQGDPKQGDPKQGDPKQGDPKQGDPKQGDPKQGDPKQGDPKQGDPKQGDPKQGDPKQGDPKQGGSKQGDPKQGDPKQGDPKQGDPKQGDPKQGGSKQGDPKQGDPKQGGSKQGDPKQGDPKQGDPKQGGSKQGDPSGSGSATDAEAGDPGSSSANQSGSDRGATDSDLSPSDESRPKDDLKNNSQEKAESSKEAFNRLKDYFDRNKGDSSNQQQDPGEKKTENPSDGKRGQDVGRKPSEPGGNRKDSPSNSSDAAKKSDLDPTGTKSSQPQRSADLEKSKKGNAKSSPSQAGKSGAADDGTKQGEPANSKSQQRPSSEKKSQNGKPDPSRSDGKQRKSDKGGEQVGNDSPDGNRTNSGGKTGEGGVGEDRQRQSKQQPRQDSGMGEDMKPGKANLDYARNATDMVLDRLKEQEDRQQQDLLDELKWTPDELKEFSKRWEKMRSKAESGSQVDKQRFDDALRSLGLTDPSNATRNQTLKDDNQEGFRQTAGVRKVPSDFARKFRSIQKSQRSLKGSSGN